MPDAPDDRPLDPESAPPWARRYDARGFPRFGYTADTVGFRLAGERGDELRALLVVRGEGGPYAGMRAWPGGFVDWSADEDGRAAALRELEEETGMGEPAFLETLGVYDRNGRDPRQHVGRLRDRDARGMRVVSRAHLGLFAPDVSPPRAAAGEDAARAGWSSVYEFLPWEDSRTETGRRLGREIERILEGHAGEMRPGVDDPGRDGCGARFRALRRAGRVEEAHRDPWGRVPDELDREEPLGAALAFDHREMLADALDHLRWRVRHDRAALRALGGAGADPEALAPGFGAILGLPAGEAGVRWLEETGGS